LLRNDVIDFYATDLIICFQANCFLHCLENGTRFKMYLFKMIDLC